MSNEIFTEFEPVPPPEEKKEEKPERKKRVKSEKTVEATTAPSRKLRKTKKTRKARPSASPKFDQLGALLELGPDGIQFLTGVKQNLDRFLPPMRKKLAAILGRLV